MSVYTKGNTNCILTSSYSNRLFRSEVTEDLSKEGIAEHTGHYIFPFLHGELVFLQKNLCEEMTFVVSLEDSCLGKYLSYESSNFLIIPVTFIKI